MRGVAAALKQLARCVWFAPRLIMLLWLACLHACVITLFMCQERMPVPVSTLLLQLSPLLALAAG